MSAEWFTYLVFPALAWFTGRLRSGWLAGTLAAASLTTLAGLTSARYGSMVYAKADTLGLLRCATEFVAGALVFRVVHLAPNVRRLGDVALVAGLALLVLAMMVKGMDWPAPFAFCFIVLACWSEGRLASLLFGTGSSLGSAKSPFPFTSYTGC